jgi:hypothetical protein
MYLKNDEMELSGSIWKDISRPQHHRGHVV